MRNEINDGHEESSLVFTRSTFEGLRETPLSRDYFQVFVQCLPSPSLNRFLSRRSWIGSSRAKLSMKEICTVGSFRLTGSKCSKVRIIMENSFHAARVGYRLPDNFCSIFKIYCFYPQHFTSLTSEKQCEKFQSCQLVLLVRLRNYFSSLSK